MKKIIFLTVLGQFIFACGDPVKIQIQSVKNSSKDTILLTRIQNNIKEKFNILPSVQTDIFIGSEFGKASEVSCISMSLVDSVYITTKSKKKLIKDIEDDKNWTSTYSAGKGSTTGSDQKCVFEIFDNDLK